jgi:hypothetical protein
MLEQNELAKLLKDLKIASVSGQANEPPIPPSNAVGRESQTLLKDSKTKIQQQHFEEKNGLLTNINDEINSAEAGGNFLSDQPDAVKLSASLENITSNNPIVRRPGAMFSEQIDRESFSFMKAVLTALQQKKVSLSEEEAIIAMNNGHVVEKKLPTPSVRQVGQPESSPSYEVTFKSGYQAVDEVRRLLGEVFGQNPIKGYSSIASATAQNLYNQLRAIQKNYLPEGVLDEYNTVIQRQIGEMSAFERGGGSGGNLVRNGDVENFSLSPFQSLKNIFDDGDVSFSNYAKLAGNESAADAFRSVIFQKIQGLNPKEIQSVLRDSKVQDIRDNLSNLGEVGDKLEKELKIFEANANIRNDTSDTQSQIKDLVNEQDRIKAKTSAAERALIQNEAIQRTQESQLNSLEMAKNTDELLAALGSNMQRNQNIPLKLGGKSIEKIGSQQNELVKALKIQKNLNRNKKIAATAAVTAAATAFAVDQKLFNNNSTK